MTPTMEPIKLLSKKGDPLKRAKQKCGQGCKGSDPPRYRGECPCTKAGIAFMQKQVCTFSVPFHILLIDFLLLRRLLRYKPYFPPLTGPRRTRQTRSTARWATQHQINRFPSRLLHCHLKISPLPLTISTTRWSALH